MDKTNEELGRLRALIDTLDNEMLALIERRIETARAIAAAKVEDEGRMLKLRPRREAEVVQRLARKADPAHAGAVRAIWRELMGHCLQVQVRTDVIIVDEDLRAPARAAFGMAPKLLRVETPEEALALTREGRAVAVLRQPLPPLEPEMTIVRAVRDDNGVEVAVAVGRLAPEEALTAEMEELTPWSPESWRGRKAMQMPIYPEPQRLDEVERELARAPQVVAIDEAMALKRELAEAAEGRAFLIQGGDCAEGFEACTEAQVRANHDLMLELGRLLPAPVVHVARAAGQYAKPRSAAMEMIGGEAIPSYRGDAVHSHEPNHEARTPDPDRLLTMHRQSVATAGLIGHLNRPAAHVYVSHEALLLHYEQALTRQDERTGRWWATSGHMVWIGERTRDPDGAHVEYARGIANPIGLKCGPTMTPDELLRMIDRLDPDNEPGRLVLIGRFGAEQVGKALPALMRATRDHGRKALWVSDPMHGNGRTMNGYKTRLVDDLLTELRGFIEVADAEGVHPGGMHLEMTAAPVTECIGGRAAIGEEDLGRCYESLCDPRLNRAQGLEVAAFAAARLSAWARAKEKKVRGRARAA